MRDFEKTMVCSLHKQRVMAMTHHDGRKLKTEIWVDRLIHSRWLMGQSVLSTLCCSTASTSRRSISNVSWQYTAHESLLALNTWENPRIIVNFTEPLCSSGKERSFERRQAIWHSVSVHKLEPIPPSITHSLQRKIATIFTRTESNIPCARLTWSHPMTMPC